MGTQTSIPMHGGRRPGWIGCPLSVTAHLQLLAKARKNRTTLGGLIIRALLDNAPGNMDQELAKPWSDTPYQVGQHETTHALHGLDVYVYVGPPFQAAIERHARQAGEPFPGRWIARKVRERWLTPNKENNPTLF